MKGFSFSPPLYIQKQEENSRDEGETRGWLEVVLDFNSNFRKDSDLDFILPQRRHFLFQPNGNHLTFLKRGCRTYEILCNPI